MLRIFLSLIILTLSSQPVLKAYDSYDYGQTSTADEMSLLKTEIQTLNERIASYTKINATSNPPMFTESYINRMRSDLIVKEGELRELEGTEDVKKAQASTEKYFFFEDSIWDKTQGSKIGPPQLYEDNDWTWSAEDENYYRESDPDGKRRKVDTQVKIAKDEV